MTINQIFLKTLCDKNIAADSNQALLEAQKAELNFEPFDGEVDFKTNLNLITVDDFEEQRNQLKHYNFSLERAEYLIKIKRVLQNDKVLGFEVLEQDLNENTQSADQNAMLSKAYSADCVDLSGFMASERLQEAIKSQNDIKIKTVLLNDLNNNTLELDYVLKSAIYALGAAPNIFEAYNEGNWADPIEKDQALWTYDYYFEQIVATQNNFSMERFLHLLNVKQYLRDKGHPEFQFIKKAPSQRSPSTQHQSQKTNKGQQNLLKVALAIGGAVLVAILALFNKK